MVESGVSDWHGHGARRTREIRKARRGSFAETTGNTGKTALAAKTE